MSMVESDKCRVRFSERSFTEKAKEIQRSSRKEDEEKFNLGEQLYGAGIAG